MMVVLVLLVAVVCVVLAVTPLRVMVADGVGGGIEFKSYGVRKIQILAVVQEIPESYFNLSVIFRWC